MASSDGDETDPREVLVDCLERPDRGKERLPYLVGLLDADERPVRVCAAWACCLVAVEDEDEDVIEYLVRRLSDRLSEETVPLELTQALDYLSAQYPDTVEGILEEIVEEESDDVPLPRVGNFTREHYYGGSTAVSREGVGRLRIAGSDAPDDPRRAYADREREEREQVEHERERESGEDRDGDDAEPEAGYSENPEAMVRRTNEVTDIAVRSRFDDLHIVGAQKRGRYARTYQALLGQGGEEKAVAIRVFRQPEDTTSRPEFGEDLRTHVRDWTEVDDHDHVIDVLDWAVEPRPWLATVFTDESLADRERPRLPQALSDAANLAGAVSHLHQHGVVHGGIDPKNVAYPGELMDASEARPPMLDNVGLMHVFRFHFEPALCLDPRYAAPEYYDTRFGQVDHETDIYQLGAVLFRLFTGRAPFTGDFSAIRERVLEADPPRPSDVDGGVPPAVDEVVSKAMAKEKLRRYETVEHMEQELAGISDG